MRKSIQQGFTLIELMIVVAIVGILAAIAIPAYQDYTVRAKISEGLAQVDQMKTMVADFYTSQGHMPSLAGSLSNNFNGSALAITGSKYVSEVDYAYTSGQQASLTALYHSGNISSQLSGANAVSFLGTGNTTTIYWTCSKAAGATLTSVPTKFLPANCR